MAPSSISRVMSALMPMRKVKAPPVPAIRVGTGCPPGKLVGTAAVNTVPEYVVDVVDCTDATSAKEFSLSTSVYASVPLPVSNPDDPAGRTVI